MILYVGFVPEIHNKLPDLAYLFFYYISNSNLQDAFIPFTS